MDDQSSWEDYIAHLEAEWRKFQDLKHQLGNILWPDSGAEGAFRTDSQNIIQKVRELMMVEHPVLEDRQPNRITELQDELIRTQDKVASLEHMVKDLREMDSEAATYVESVICMRTGFTGEEPYVGWKGLGLALTEALDDRDRLRAEVETAWAYGERVTARLNELRGNRI